MTALTNEEIKEIENEIKNIETSLNKLLAIAGSKDIPMMRRNIEAITAILNYIKLSLGLDVIEEDIK